MGQSAQLGICSVQVNPLNCDGEPDPALSPLFSCNITQVGVNTLITEEIVLDDPSGIPGKRCVEVRIDPELDHYDIVLTTCSVFDQELDALLGLSDTIDDATGKIIGSKALKKATQPCMCECGDQACKRRVAVTTWSMNICPGSGDQPQQFHPDGKYWVNVFPMVQFRPTAETTTINAELNGRTYTARAFENPAFGQGPGAIIPATQAPFDRCRYQFASTVCPPADSCNCLSCNSVRPTPLAV